MSEPGIYTLMKIITGGLSAIATGPMGDTELPDIKLQEALGGNQSSYAAEVISPNGSSLGWSGHDRPGSPRILDLPEMFIFALLSVEDAHFGLHPGIDPIAVASAGFDTLLGDRRGGSTITQQLVKNAVTGPELTIDRKLREGILAVRAQAAFPPDELLQAYLAKAWFGRGQKGAAGAALAWFGKTWSEIEIHEAAFLAGILKGPSFYDPLKYPERSKARRDLVISMMHQRRMISESEMNDAQAKPITVITQEQASEIFDRVPHWVSSGIFSDFERYGLMNRSDISSGDFRVTTTIDPDWQSLAEEALIAGISRLSPPGPVKNINLPDISYGDPLSGSEVEAMRNEAVQALASTHKSGRAIILKTEGQNAFVIIDRGFGKLEWDKVSFNQKELGFKPARGDVLPYKRVNDMPELQSAPQVQGAVVVMNPENGAILATVGGTDPDLFPFDRTDAQRQPGSSLKPFLWARAMSEGMRYDDLVEDIERNYHQPGGQVWRPRNYDHSQSGLIPLFVGLEESSNLVAASLSDQMGISALSTITELAGIYEWGGMRRHVSSALGASETSLTRMAAGYSALANGGLVVTPHHVGQIERDGRILWTPPGAEESYAIATRETIDDISSMLYGVTQRGTAYRAFKGFDVPVAGKTGTTEGYRDAWFMSFTPGVVVGVWIGRDDFNPIPGRPSGSRAAAPVARQIYESALNNGLLEENGYRPGQETFRDWPPELLQSGRSNTSPQVHRSEKRSGDPFKRQDDTPIAITPDPIAQGYLSQSGTVIQNQHSDRGYLQSDQDRNNRLISPEAPRSESSGLIFKSPW